MVLLLVILLPFQGAAATDGESNEEGYQTIDPAGFGRPLTCLFSSSREGPPPTLLFEI